MRRRIFAVAGCVALMCAANAQAQVIRSEHHSFRIVTVADGLKDPWSIAFLPNGDMLVTEKPGNLRIVRAGKLDPAPIPGTPKVRYAGQGGLLEVLPHHDFAKNQTLYLSYSKPNADGSEGTTAVLRAKFDGKQLSEVKEIFEAKAWSKAGPHYAGKLVLDRKGHLFITVGDRGHDPFAGAAHPSQSLMSHQGKVIRLNEDGSVPKDNPFVGRKDALPEIWSYGHRNPQGLVMNYETGELFETEHGPQGGDELNLIEAGKNYGWPVIGYGVQYGGKPIHEAREKPGMEQPLQYWVPAIGASGLMIYTGDKFPKWKGNMFLGALAAKHVARINLTRAGEKYQVESLERPALLPGYARIREVRQGPDGNIYLAIDDRAGGGLTSVVRLEPAA
ncbi:MAG: PQQ-dependent sugar dehydrogenase [Rhodospirillaceae bacterium]